MLKFFGSGAGFADQHTSAYFVTKDDDLVVIDCPVTAFFKLKKMELSKYKDIYVLITHTHGDHIGGLGLFVQFAFFVAKKNIIIVAPSPQVAKDVETILRIEDNELSWYKLITASDLKEKEWFNKAILTEHSTHQLKGKCFGYQLYIEEHNCVYTGDTSTLEPFLPYLKAGSFLFVDISVHYGIVHLKLEDAIPVFKELNKKGVSILLMHLDDIYVAANILEANGFDSKRIGIVVVE